MQFLDRRKIGNVQNIFALSDRVTGNIFVNLAAAHCDDIYYKEAYYLTNGFGAYNLQKVCSGLGHRARPKQ